MSNYFELLKGAEINGLKIIDYFYVEMGGRKRSKFKFQCKCGNIGECFTDRLTSGSVKSCGCEDKRVKHGFTNDRLYKIWSDMKQRCYNEKRKSFKNYGALGIRVCDEWINNFENFRDWALKNGYEEHLTIERINVKGDYEPNNCDWITIEEQQKNKNWGKYSDSRRKVILQLDKDTKEVINEFVGINATQKKLGITGIHLALKDENRTAGGYRWRYKGE